MIERMVFCIGTLFSGKKKVRLWDENGRLFLSYEGDEYQNGIVYSKEVTKEERAVFEKKIEALNIYSWRKDYDNLRVLDGIQWSLDYKETDKKNCRHIYGSNLYPECWNAFIDVVEELAPELHENIGNDEGYRI